jgi:membrane protein YqaA with SNARE-associated domain
MLSQKLHSKLKSYVATVQGFADRYWYPPFIGFLAALDNFIIIIPNDGILISSSMLTPKRWLWLAFCVAVGSTIGAVGLAALIETLGLPWLIEMFPGIDQSPTWKMTDEFFSQYGLIVVFIVALAPIMQQPAVILACLADTRLLLLGVVIFVGRFIKFIVMAYVGSHAPRLLEKMWGVKDELADAGIKIKDEK